MGIIPGMLGFIFGIIGIAQNSNNKAPAIIGLILSIFAGMVMMGNLFTIYENTNNQIQEEISTINNTNIEKK